MVFQANQQLGLNLVKSEKGFFLEPSQEGLSGFDKLKPYLLFFRNEKEYKHKLMELYRICSNTGWVFKPGEVNDQVRLFCSDGESGDFIKELTEYELSTGLPKLWAAYKFHKDDFYFTIIAAWGFDITDSVLLSHPFDPEIMTFHFKVLENGLLKPFKAYSRMHYMPVTYSISNYLINNELIIPFHNGDHFPGTFRKKGFGRKGFKEVYLDKINSKVIIPESFDAVITEPDSYAYESIIPAAEIPDCRLGRFPVNVFWPLRNPELLGKRKGWFYGFVQAAYASVKDFFRNILSEYFSTAN